MDSNNLIEGLLQKPLWQMTGGEYCQLTHYVFSGFRLTQIVAAGARGAPPVALK